MRRHPLVFAYVAALIPSMLMAITQPVWSRVDEAQHADFIIQLSRGNYPIADRSLIDPETLRVMQSTGVFRFEGPGSYPTPDVSDIGPPPAGMAPRANAVWMSRHLWQLSYESAQTPGYYALMVPFWAAADRLSGTLAAIYLMRFINALLIALLAPMAVVVAWRLAPNRPAVAAVAALFAILLPGLALNATRVGNDALAAVLGGLVVVLALKWTGGAWTGRRATFLGLALGAGVLVKLTLLGLAPAVALGMLWPTQSTPWPRRVAFLMLTGAIIGACLCIWFAINLHLYGVAVPSVRTNRLSIVPPMQFDVRYVPFDIAFFVVSYWGGEPLGALPYSPGFVVLGVLVTLIAVFGLLGLRTSRDAALVAIVAIGGMLAVAFLLPVTAAFQFAGPGRYEYPALPATAALTSIGLMGALARTFAWRALAAMYGLAAVAILVAGAAGFAADASPTGPGAPPINANLLNARAAAQLGGVQIQIDQVGLDAANHATWVHLTVSNPASDEAEWNPAAVVSAGSVVATVDYSRSTHFPGDLDAGQSSSGWLYIPFESHTGETLHLVFLGVATDGYHTVADVPLDLSL